MIFICDHNVNEDTFCHLHGLHLPNQLSLSEGDRTRLRAMHALASAQTHRIIKKI